MFENGAFPALRKGRSSSLSSSTVVRSLTSRTAAAPCWKALLALCWNVAQSVDRVPSPLGIRLASRGLALSSYWGSRRRIKTAFPLTSMPA